MHTRAGPCSLQRPGARLAQAAGARRRPPPPARGVRAYQAPYQGAASSSDADLSDIVSYAKRRLRHRHAGETQLGPVSDFMRKLHLAWRVFFPEQPRIMTPKEEGKQRLRMILVADRWARGRGRGGKGERAAAALACVCRSPVLLPGTGRQGTFWWRAQFWQPQRRNPGRL